MWTSQSPGKRYMPSRSITSACRRSGERLPSRTSAIRPRSITTLPPTIGRSPTQSMTLALVSTSRGWVMANRFEADCGCSADRSRDGGELADDRHASLRQLLALCLHVLLEELLVYRVLVEM